MFHISVDYPSEDEERSIVESTTSRRSGEPSVVITASEILRFQELMRKVPITNHVLNYAIRLVRATRDGSVPSIQEYVNWGAGPRAGQYLIAGGKAAAAMDGRPCVSLDDIRKVAIPVLRHRISTNFQAQAEGFSTDDLVSRLIEEVPEPNIPKYE